MPGPEGQNQPEETVPSSTQHPDPQWYIAKMRDLYARDPGQLDESWRAYFSTESAPPQLRSPLPAMPTAPGAGAAPVLPEAGAGIGAARTTPAPGDGTTPPAPASSDCGVHQVVPSRPARPVP